MGHQRKHRAPEACINLYTPAHRADLDHAMAYERIYRMRKTAIDVRGAADKIAKVWKRYSRAVAKADVGPEMPLVKGPASGPIGLMWNSVAKLGWSWMKTPWGFERPGHQALPLAQGPKRMVAA